MSGKAEFRVVLTMESQGLLQTDFQHGLLLSR
jgi:hypothetical protein